MISNEQVIKDFRRILRHFQSFPSFQSTILRQKQNLPSSTLRVYVLDKYRVGRKETNKRIIDSLRLSANSYAILISNIKELKYLRYLDSGEKLDQRDKIRATAARVGLSVPKFSDEGFAGNSKKTDDESNSNSEDKNATCQSQS